VAVNAVTGVALVGMGAVGRLLALDVDRGYGLGVVVVGGIYL